MPTEDHDIASLAGLLIVKPEGNAEAAAKSATPDNTADDDLDLIADTGNPDDGEGADEGTDTDAGEGDEGEAGDEADGEQADPNEPLYPVVINGETKHVPLKEALAGYQRQDDYTRKTTEAAEARKKAETEAAEFASARGQYLEVLKVLKERVGPEDQERTPDQWLALRQEDPSRYAEEWAASQQRKEQRDAITKEQERVIGEQRQEQTNKLKAFVADEGVKLLAKFPEWKDPKKYEAGAKAIFDYAKTIGFSDQELSVAYDHRMLVMADKARRFDAIVAARAKVQNKVNAAPDMPAPGVRVSQPSRRQAAKVDAEKKFARSGKLDDALPLMFK